MENGRRIGFTQVETVMLGGIEFLEQPLGQRCETPGDESLAGGGCGGNPDTDFAVGVFQTPPI